MAVNPNDFLFNSDYELDKIVYFHEGTHTAASSGNFIFFPTGLNFVPLCFGVWSTTSDFSQPIRMTNTNHGFYGLTNTPSVTLISSSSDKTIFLTFSSFPDNTKVYYRIYGFAPSNYTGDAPETSSNASSFILNTDYNYRKLYQKGRVKSTPKSSTPSQFDTLVVNHNLGYIPQIMAWEELAPIDPNTGQETGTYSIQYCSYVNMRGFLSDPEGVTVDSEKITFRSQYYAAGFNSYFNYRIYYDQA